MSTPLLARGLLTTAVAIAFILSACSQSPPPSQATSTATQSPAQNPPAQDAPANPPASASPSPQQNASVAELLAPPAEHAPANGAPAEAAPTTASAPAETAPAAANAPADEVEYATVVSVKKIEGPQQVCHDETVVEKREPQDKHKVAGTAIGAIAGGLIGSQIGGGRGKTVATVGGAVAGGAVGRKVQENQQEKDTVTRVVKRCRPVSEAEAGKPLYDIVYSYQGQTYQARLDYDPGDRVALPVRSVE